MYQPREFFDQLMSPFILQAILLFTFSNHNEGDHSVTEGMQIASKQGCQFLRILFYNMFIAEPHDAIQDVMEINFGFQLTQIAGVSVEQFKAANAKSDATSEEKKAEGDSGSTA